MDLCWTELRALGPVSQMLQDSLKEIWGHKILHVSAYWQKGGGRPFSKCLIQWDYFIWKPKHSLGAWILESEVLLEQPKCPNSDNDYIIIIVKLWYIYSMEY